MWYQALPQFKNPLSPRKAKDVDPDSHAHSPRRESEQGRSIMTPSSTTHATPISRALEMPSALSFATANKHGESRNVIHQQPIHLPDPFVGDTRAQRGLPSSFSQWLREYQKHPPSIGDVSMRDRSTVSSSDHDQSMPDYSRPISPNSLQSIQMADYSRPPSYSSALSHTYADSHPPSTSSSEASRQASDWEHAISAVYSVPMVGSQHSKGQNPNQTTRVEDAGKEASTTGDSGTEEQNSSYFEEGLAAYSPGRVPTAGINAPANTRANSAANTPPAATRPSAAKEARESSYTGKTRVASITTREGPSPAIRSASEGNVRTRTSSHTPTSGKDVNVSKPQAIMKTPSSDVKGKKEGRVTNIELDVPPKHQLSLTRTASGSHEKENSRTGRETGLHAGDQKRRRVSNHTERDTSLNIHANNENRAVDRASDSNDKSSSPAKHYNDIDDVTVEGIISRSALGDLSENIM